MNKKRIVNLFNRHKEAEIFHVTPDGYEYHDKDKAAAEQHAQKLGGAITTVTRAEAEEWEKEMSTQEAESKAEGGSEPSQAKEFKALNRERIAGLFTRFPESKAFCITSDGMEFHNIVDAAKHASAIKGIYKVVTREEAEGWSKKKTAPPVKEETPVKEEDKAPVKEETPAKEETTTPVKEETPAKEEDKAPVKEETPAKLKAIKDMTATEMKKELTELGVEFKGNASTAELAKLLKANRK